MIFAIPKSVEKIQVVFEQEPNAMGLYLGSAQAGCTDLYCYVVTAKWKVRPKPQHNNGRQADVRCKRNMQSQGWKEAAIYSAHIPQKLHDKASS